MNLVPGQIGKNTLFGNSRVLQQRHDRAGFPCRKHRGENIRRLDLAFPSALKATPYRPPNRALKSARRLGVFSVPDCEARQAFDMRGCAFAKARGVCGESSQKALNVDGVEHGQKQVFERRIYVTSFRREPDGAMQGAFEIARQSRHNSFGSAIDHSKSLSTACRG